MKWSTRLIPKAPRFVFSTPCAGCGGRDVLEIGAGNGRLTWRYAERAASVLGVEPDEGRVGRAIAARPNALRDRVDFRHADVVTADLPAARFDVVLFSWSI